MPLILPTLAQALLVFATTSLLHAQPVGTSLLRGTATIIDGSAIPPESRLRVNLHDLSPGVAKDATVATATFEAEGKSPVSFELPYTKNLIDPKHLYGVAGAIMNSRGQTLWATRVPIRVLTLGNEKKVQLVLRPVERPKAPPEPRSFAVQCEGLSIDVELNDASATVTLPESQVVLPRTKTSSGKRFSDGAVTLAVSGTAVYFQVPGRVYRDCKVRPDAKPPAGNQ